MWGATVCGGLDFWGASVCGGLLAILDFGGLVCLSHSLCALHSLHYPKMYLGVPVKPNPVKDLNRICCPLVSDPRP